MIVNQINWTQKIRKMMIYLQSEFFFSDIQKKEERTEAEWKKTSTTSIIIGN